MSEEIKLTIQSDLKLGMNYPCFHKWDILKHHGGGETIVIRLSNTGEIGKHSVQYTMHPYKRFERRWKQWLWLTILKVRVFIGDLYKD